MRAAKFILVLSLWTFIQCSPFDDGKYRPIKYQIYDDGKYYRPLDEGKYIPSDEGKYSYIYQQGIYGGLYDDKLYGYVHQTGAQGGRGGFGGNGGVGGVGGEGGIGGEGGVGPDGPGGPGGPGFPIRPNFFSGVKTYADRYPYIHKVINGLVEKYVSSSGLHFGDEYEGSSSHYRKVYADKEIAVKCKYLTPNFKVNETTPEFVTQYPPTSNVPAGEKFGSYYSFRGSKILNTVANSLKNKLKLEYEVFVRVVDEVSN